METPKNPGLRARLVILRQHIPGHFHVWRGYISMRRIRGHGHSSGVPCNQNVL